MKRPTVILRACAEYDPQRVQQIVGEASQHGPMDNINLLRGQLAHNAYAGPELQAGIDWINNH